MGVMILCTVFHVHFFSLASNAFTLTAKVYPLEHNGTSQTLTLLSLYVSFSKCH